MMSDLRVLPGLAVIGMLFGIVAPLRAEATAPASERFRVADATATPDFQKHVVPLLGRLGCNSRACHGSFQGQGGLRLSLFGYDFRMDQQSLTAGAKSRAGARIDLKAPAQSLVLQKPSLQVEHEGGERFAVDSWQYNLLRRWILTGALGVDRPAKLARLHVEPQEIVFTKAGSPVPLKVIAIWEDDQQEDVTALCRFRTNNDAVANVDSDGLVTSTGAGDTHVVVFYDNGIAAVPILQPYQSGRPVAAPVRFDEESIDTLVQAKLDKLGLVPSAVCSDSQFLRRVSLDLTGTLPTPREIESFLSDTSVDKRTRKIDELLERPAYAAWWANKLCDFTGCNPAQQAEIGQETSAQWYMWIYARLRENVPYDQLARRIVLARSRETGQSFDDYAAQVSAYFRTDAPADFAHRETMPHYWTRRSMQKPEDAAQAFAHNFLGVRLQCAQCHKHPFASWTQDDFREFSRFFESIKFGVEPQSLDRYRKLAGQVGLNAKDAKGVPISVEVLKQAQRGRTIPWRELYTAPREKELSLELLRSRTVTLAADQDPRLAIWDWMSEPDNPWFARAFVNRVWASYFLVGIVDPPDDLNPANPPSNPALLQWLVRSFVDHQYDIKWLHREIVRSDTYQRSWEPNDTNREDRKNYSRAIPRRLPAEVVYDAVKQALAARGKEDDVRTDLSRRAIGELSMRLAGTYAMQVFGKPDRAVNCDCERSNQPTLLQAIFLQNDPLIEQRLEESGWLLDISRQEAGDEPLNRNELIREAWLRTVSRPPTVDESTRAKNHLQAAASVTDGLRDLLWALINTKEFLLVQ